MKTYAPKPPRKARHIRVPAFLPVPLRSRKDGWTPFRQAAFLVALARTGSVAAAAREVGLSRVSAYRLRGRAGAASFAATWDLMLDGGAAPKRKFTSEERFRAGIEGRIAVQVWRGRCAGIWRKYDAAAFRGLVLRIKPGDWARALQPERSHRFG